MRCDPDRRKLQQLLQDLVGTICRPHVLDADPDPGLTGQIGRQFGPQADGIAVGIAVQIRRGVAYRGRDVVDECLARRMRVLIGVEPHRHVQLGVPRTGLAAQILPQRQVVQGDTGCAHFSNLRRTASPCAGRFSACDSVIT